MQVSPNVRAVQVPDENFEPRDTPDPDFENRGDTPDPAKGGKRRLEFGYPADGRTDWGVRCR